MQLIVAWIICIFHLFSFLLIFACFEALEFTIYLSAFEHTLCIFCVMLLLYLFTLLQICSGLWWACLQLLTFHWYRCIFLKSKLLSEFLLQQEAQLKQGLADRTAKTAVSAAISAKPEVEIRRRPKKSTLWPWFPIRSFRQFFARTYRFATIQ